MTTGFFEKGELAGFRDVLHEKLRLHPLDQLFPDEVHEGTGIDVDVEVHSTFAADPTDRGEPSPYASPNAFRTIRAEPVQIRNARPLSNKEVSFFRGLGELGQVSGLTGSLATKRARKITDLTRKVVLPVEERRHAMQAEALQGSVSLRIGGVVQAFSYGINDLTVAAGTPDWSNAAATIVQDIYKIADEFEVAGNVRADTVIFDKRMFGEYFIKNTEWKALVDKNEGMAKAFQGFFQADGDLRAMVAPTRPFQMFDMTWIPVSGSYIDKLGATNQRWNLKKLALLALDAGDGQRVLEWASNQDEYNPAGLPAMRDWTQQDPIAHKVEYSLNGVPMIYIKERVQVVTIEP